MAYGQMPSPTMLGLPRIWTTPNGARMEQAPGHNAYRIGWSPGHQDSLFSGRIPTMGGLGFGASHHGMISDNFGQGQAPQNQGAQSYQPFPGVWTTPPQIDYGQAIQNDPGYMASHSSIEAQMQQAAAMRDAALKALNYGYDGSGNDFSTLKQYNHALSDLQHGLTQDQMDSTNQMAARGALHSSEQPSAQNALQYQFDQNKYGLDTQKYNEERSYQQSIADALNNYLSAQNSGSYAEAQALQDAAGRVASNPLYQPTSGYAGLVDNWQQQYGQPIYRDLSGNLWALDGSGNPVRYS